MFSTTLSHLIATNSAPFLIPFVPIRERLKEKVEHFFGCEYELCIEFTGLIRLVFISFFLFQLYWTLVLFFLLLVFNPPRLYIYIYILEIKSAGVEELALDGTVMITGPISSNGTLRYLIYFYVIFAFYVLS